MTAEARAERRHPPIAARRVLLDRRLQHEIHARAAHVAVIAENGGAAPRGIFAEADPLTDSREDFTSTRVQNPRRDVLPRRAPSARARLPERHRHVSPPGWARPCVRIFLSMPRRRSNRSSSRSPASSSVANDFHSMLRRPGGGAALNTAAPAPSPNRHALISTPGSSSRYIAALQISTQIDNTWAARPDAIRASAIRMLGSAAPQPCPTRSSARMSGRSPMCSLT